MFCAAIPTLQTIYNRILWHICSTIDTAQHSFLRGLLRTHPILLTPHIFLPRKSAEKQAPQPIGEHNKSHQKNKNLIYPPHTNNSFKPQNGATNFYSTILIIKYLCNDLHCTIYTELNNRVFFMKTNMIISTPYNIA